MGFVEEEVGSPVVVCLVACASDEADLFEEDGEDEDEDRLLRRPRTKSTDPSTRRTISYSAISALYATSCIQEMDSSFGAEAAMACDRAVASVR